MNYTNIEKEIKALDLQIFISIIFIITTIVSIIINYNENYYLKYHKRFIDLDDAVKITKINRVIIIILFITFIYINYQIKDVDKLKNKDLTPDNLEIIASYFSLIAGLIILYVVFKYSEDALTTTENPSV